MQYTRLTKAFIALMAIAAAAMIANAAIRGQSWHPYLALTLLAIAMATSRMKVTIPGINGNMSVNLPFLMLSIILLSATESILIACASSIIQTLPKDGTRLKPVRILFNLSMMAFSSGAAGLLFHQQMAGKLNWMSAQLLLAGATAAFFLGQTLPVSAIVALTDGGGFHRIWMSIAQMSFPYYVLSAGLTSMVESVGHSVGWLAALAVLPIMFGIYRSYRLYFAKVAEPASFALARAARSGA
ncbi:MAG TPA: hypothetical protein VLT90_13245 [Terriglobales bacterium]|nr:hypothetical protein [Terriglobales bacterium]